MNTATQDWSGLAAWLEAHVPGFAGPLAVHAFDGGQSNPTYELRTPARSYVLRRKPAGRLLSSAHAVDREFRVLSALAPTGLPVPRPYALCEDEGVIGTIFYVMEKADGRIFRDPLLAELPPAERRQAYIAMVETLARLQSLAPADLGLEDFGRPGN
jgi:aminoglycoside phosphotransferase (APT) family kinase protein